MTVDFTVQNHERLREALLDDWAGLYDDNGLVLDTEPDSDAYNQADAFSHQLEALQARALQATKEIFPDTASKAKLEKHAAQIGLPRKPAVRARLNVTVTGTGSYTTGDALNAPDGTRYLPVSGGSVAGSGPVLVEAQEAGVVGNKPVGMLFTWSSAPSGLGPTAAVSSSATNVVAGADAESDASLARRVIAWWRERPGGGNRADWVNWCEEVAEVAVAFCYPLRDGSGTDDVLGCVRNIVLGPVPTATTDAGEPAQSGTRILSGGVIAKVTALLRGTGDYASTGGKIPCVLNTNDVTVAAAAALPTDVTIELVMGPGYSFPFAGTMTVIGGSATTVTVSSIAVGLVDECLVAVPDVTVRGGYAYRRVTSHTSGSITLDAPLSTALVGGTVYPLPANAPLLRAAILAVVDSLGPGLNAGGSGESVRHPDESWGEFYGTLYPATLEAACMGVPGLPGAPASVAGVLSAEATAPASAVVAAAEQLITLGTLLFVEA